MIYFASVKKIAMNHKRLWLSIVTIGLLLAGGLPADEPKNTSEREKFEAKADEIQMMNPRMAREAIRALDESTALSIYDIMVARAGEKGVGPQTFYLAEHIQLLRATEASQKRLESLIWVLGLTLLLFAGYLTYVLIDQRRIYGKLQALQNSSPVREAERTVYTGE